MPKKIFFSYTHEDEALRKQLGKHLKMMERDGLVKPWHDRLITAGSSVDDEIDSHLQEADIVLLLISSDFIDSDYCYSREMKRALERHDAGEALVIPVILRYCDWHSAPFGGLLATPLDGKPVKQWSDKDEAFLDVVNHIRKVVEKMTGDSPRTPAVVDLPSEHSSQTVSSPSAPRSSNLRLRKTFTDMDRDSFLEESFEYMGRFFENSIKELNNQNSGIQGRFKRIDSQHFSAVVYNNGQVLTRCKIWYGGPHSFTNGIAYSENDYGGDNSFNELLSVMETNQALFLHSLGMALMFADEDLGHLTKERAAEAYWALFIKPLQ